MAIEPADALELEVRIAASAQTVFKFLTDPGEITRWMGTSATLDPRPGGVYRVNVTGRDIARGEFLEVTTFSRVVFTWGWEGQGSVVAPGSSTVEVSLVEEGDTTIVKLRHTGLPVEEQEKHRGGWETLMPRMVVAAEGGDPGPNPFSDQ